MESAFDLDEGSRADFVKHVMESFDCSYICLWRSYFPDCLLFFYGVYDGENQPSTSSSGISLARRLFDQYRLSMFPIARNECVPGFAFKNSINYLEMQEIDLQRLASLQVQKQFYREARIKKAVFMGCKSGEIELGFANVISHMNIKKELITRGWLSPQPFSKSQQSPSPIETINQLSSSSSSLISLSNLDSPESSSLIFNTTIQTSSSPSMSTSSIPHDHNFFTDSISRMRDSIHLPPSEIKDAEITRAILAVLSSDSSPSSTRNSTPSSSFRNYVSSPLAPRAQARGANEGLGVRKQAMAKRSISFLRSLNLSRIRNRGTEAATRPTTSQLHHMILERKRREKLNESFHSLKSLLPPGTKVCLNIKKAYFLH